MTTTVTLIATSNPDQPKDVSVSSIDMITNEERNGFKFPIYYINGEPHYKIFTMSDLQENMD
ncbi:hypothetical protein [Paenibacillus polymyxa]|uniref:hypothetical protein n=1 Tax=Paenibacillus polymyxa TaxID=1406 RepID=UPI00111B228A|nr:hypothetical protein [Paenibacillus polymyxa]QDA30272.1 hypothetical protein FGY93_25510 [Paenibacillus polymyxa]